MLKKGATGIMMRIIEVTGKNDYNEKTLVLNSAYVSIVTEPIARTFVLDLQYIYHRLCSALPIDTSTMTLTKIIQSLMAVDEQGRSLGQCIVFKNDRLAVVVHPSFVEPRFRRNKDGKMEDTWSVENGSLLRGLAIKNIYPALMISVYGSKQEKKKFLPVDDPRMQKEIIYRRDQILAEIAGNFS